MTAQYESGEAYAFTDASGNWSFPSLAALPTSKYAIRVAPVSHYALTAPRGGAYVLRPSPGQVVAGLLFGAKHTK